MKKVWNQKWWYYEYIDDTSDFWKDNWTIDYWYDSYDSYDWYSWYGWYKQEKYSTSTKYTQYTPKTYEWWSWWKNSWWSWNSVNIETIQEKLKNKKVLTQQLNKVISEKNIIARKYIWWSLWVSRNRWIYWITIPNEKSYWWNINKIKRLIELWRKFPNTSYVNSQKIIVEELIERKDRWDGYIMDLVQNCWLTSSEESKLYTAILNYLNQSFLTENEVKELIKLIPEKIKEKLEKKEKPWYGWITQSEEESFKMPRYQNKIKVTIPPVKIKKEISLLRWKRINRWYINHTDYRPLVSKTKNPSKRKEILILIDASWSMADTNNLWHYFYNEAVNFAADLVKTDLFDIWIFHTCDRQVIDITHQIKELSNSNTEIKMTWIKWSEWFELLTNRLSHIPRNEDYVLVFTDMYVPSDAEENLKLFIWQKKHMVLNFGDKKQFQNLNVRYVKEHKDMQNVITTILGS